MDFSINKFQIAAARTADTIHNFFMGAHPATIIDNARATSELTKGIRAFYKKTQNFPYTPDEETPERKCTRLLSNFAKHADRDADRSAEYNNAFALNAVADTVENFINTFNVLYNQGVIDMDLDDLMFTEATSAHSTLSIPLLPDSIKKAFPDNKQLLDKDLMLVNSVLFICIQFKQYYADFAEQLLNNINKHNVEQLQDNYNQASTQLKGETALKIVSVYSALRQTVVTPDLETRKEYLDQIHEIGAWPIPHNSGFELQKKFSTEKKLNLDFK